MARYILIALLVLPMAACNRAGDASKTASAGGEKTLRIAVIPKGTTHVFWKSHEKNWFWHGCELGLGQQVWPS